MSLLAGVMDKLALASGASWLGVLPWALLAWGASVAGAGAWGWHEGGAKVTAEYRAAQAGAGEAAAQAMVVAAAHAADTSLEIISAARDTLGELNLSMKTRQQIVAKVRADARADAKLAGCTVPPVTGELRKSQVDQSAAIAAQDRPM